MDKFPQLRPARKLTARQHPLPDPEIVCGEISRVTLHELEQPFPATIIPKSGLNVCLWHKADMTTAFGDVCFSNRPVGVKRFQTIHDCGIDVTRGLVLLYGI